MADTKWWEAPQVAEIAEEVMAMGFTELEDHHYADIRYIFSNKEAGRDGCKILASTRKVPGLIAAQLQPKGLAASAGDAHARPTPVFIIQVWSEGWATLDARAQRALVHHELCHIDPVEARLVPHYIEEHRSTAARFGPWRDALEQFRLALDLYGEKG